ncbi:hypothetical protein, partial [Streptococcus agalactiae]|uniref:hypothetical protein n=1 Tax=Streptococcus agalactiae TaxID=1311 RepID=UPI002B4A6212
RGSGSLAIRQTRIALEIEPHRYAKIIMPSAVALITRFRLIMVVLLATSMDNTHIPLEVVSGKAKNRE